MSTSPPLSMKEKIIFTFLPNQYELFDIDQKSLNQKENQTKSFYCSIIHCDKIDQYARKIALLTLNPLGNTLPVKLFYDQVRILPPSQSYDEKILLDRDTFYKSVHYTLRILAFLYYKESFEATQLPYLILPVTEEGQIAWDEISRTFDLPYSVQIEDDDFQDCDLDKFQDRAIFEGTQPWTDRPFIPLKFRPDLRAQTKSKDEEEKKVKRKSSTVIVQLNHRKFAKVDFEKINLQSNLLEMRNIPPAQNFLRYSLVSIHKYSTLPSLCMLGALSARILCSARLLPSILTAFERTFLARQLKDEILPNININESKLIQALTVPSAMMESDYQQLEYLGDCVLKLIGSCIVFCNDGLAGEGQLTKDRQNIISNEHLTNISEKLQIAQHCFGPEPIPKAWKPHGLWQRSLKISNKMSADLIEAILGAAWLSDDDATIGLQCAVECFNKLKIYRQDVSLATFDRLHEGLWIYTEFDLPLNARSYVDKLESILDYKFKYPQMAISALTHSSVSSILKPSYQRLEFLGDSILDVFVVQLFYKLYPSLNEGEYSKMKSESISNLSLGIACINTGLPELILHDCKSLHINITKFRSSIRLAKRKQLVDEKRKPFWIDEEIRKSLLCPKQISDIVESVIGAIFVDSDFNLEKTRKVFVRVFESHFLTYFGERKGVEKSTLIVS